ncbi:nucleoporin Pom152 [Hortaea werneckii]|uniref:Nucleoporin Pom152 n=1 Tax=Hortaea werneckii TaxID=91943 RepID=A0A3M7E008_HORWE|nr:nucleoporin Pom152 [Hortaea werneckii]KAI6861929.1 nucleoporin Pom152 [Hortaea werneckii]RMY69720.1 hypothetical protein D0862_14837 [Hortaea werneckii]
MDGTPRLRSAFPATPQTTRRTGQARGGSPGIQRPSERLPDIPIVTPSIRTSPPDEPLIPEHVIDAPSQRLYAFTLYCALFAWKVYDFNMLNDTEEQSLWLFMKWIAIDGTFLFGLPNFRIPWLEWSSATMTLLFLGHAVLDGMMMFRIGIPIAAAFGAVNRSVWGAYELAVNEHKVNPKNIEFNESLILGRQIIHILPEGSAVLNPERDSFCIDGMARTEARLPITINSTNPIAMEMLRVDLETQANETIHISKSQIKTMHREASRLITYSDKINEPKTLYYPVKKPGLYVLAKVIDESNLEVARKRMAHTVVVPCPKANVLPASSDRCRGELSSVDIEVTGTPPMRVKYRKMVNSQPMDATFESIQPEDFVSPLASVDRQSAVTVPAKVDTAWARPQKVRVPLSESLATSGKWVYSISEVQDGFGNTVTYTDRDHDAQERQGSKSSQLHQVISVHERPTINLRGCTPQNPLKVAKGQAEQLPVQFGSTGRGEIADTPYHIEYIFSRQKDVSSTGEHTTAAQQKRETVKSSRQKPLIQEAGLYTITGVSTDFCRGDVLEPASCLLTNPPEPKLSISQEEIFDKCAGSPIGLRVDLDLLGTPPFDVHYQILRKPGRVHEDYHESVNGLRGQMELTPAQAGEYEYIFKSVSDAVYKNRPLDMKLKQSVKPAASAKLINKDPRKVSCIDDSASFDVALQGEGPFSIEYEIVHNGKRNKFTRENISDDMIKIETDSLRDGGEYTLALVSVTDRMGCKEFLKDEAKIQVRHQKPKVGFGHIEGKRKVDMLEGNKVQLPLRLAGEGPWSISYLDQAGKTHSMKVHQPNDRLTVEKEGVYKLTDVMDAYCPGQVDEPAKQFEISWIPRPELRISQADIVRQDGNKFIKNEVCEGEEDAVEVLFKGASPFFAQYTLSSKLDHGTVAPRNKELRAAVNVASMRMDTSQAGTYDYTFKELKDNNYNSDPRRFTPVTVQQKVNARPSVAFANPGKTYSYCSVESDGEEVIPIILHGAPPFNVEVEIKHHGTARPETVSLTDIHSLKHELRIPHSRLHLGKSAVSLRRVSDSRGCSRLLDSTTPRVMIAVHDAPTISPLENHADFCVGDRINFALSGVAPFNVFYEFEGAHRKATATGTTFRRLAEKPGTFTVTGVQDSASQCKASTSLVRHIHGMPSVRVSQGRDSYVDIHEGGEVEILFEFGGTPPFEFTYTRSSNTDRSGKHHRKGVVLDMRHEVSDEYSMRVRAHEEGTYEVVAIRDRYCAYAKPGVNVNWKEAQRKLGY